MVGAGREVVGERLAGAGGVRSGAVVDSGCCEGLRGQLEVLGADAEEAGGIAGAEDGRRRGRGSAAQMGDVQGMDRFPMNLMEGTRSAWAAACRRALVASILAVCIGLCVCVRVWMVFSSAVARR